MNKKDLSERDICTKYITPAVKLAGWDEITQLRFEFSQNHSKDCNVT
jgi:type I restriction enzyme R subunit